MKVFLQKKVYIWWVQSLTISCVYYYSGSVFSINGVVNVVKRNKMLMKLSNRLISNIRRNPLLSRTKETKKL